jgi:hypothetical protein
MDYNRHLLAYLQAWRQLLEASAAMTTALPFGGAPAGMPAPGISAGPPNDYAQQLFAYLQAWRENLEHAMGAASAPGTPQTGSSPSDSQSPPPPKPRDVLTEPEQGYATEILANFPSRMQEVSPQPDVVPGTAFGMKSAAVSSGASAPPVTKSLFGAGGAQTSPAPEIRAARDPRRAAPPPTSRWWEAGQGAEPAAHGDVAAKDLLNIPPIDQQIDEPG